jgi:D-beta-D-heptose 7-phosphate kinase/D-beta-D-heptose 1-phosphate adenosyltransferase
MRCIGGGQQMLRVDRETPGPIADDIGRGLVQRLESALHDDSVLVLSDYGKGVLTRDVIRGGMAAAKRRGRPVIVDPKGRDYSIYQGADIITPNRNELADATGLPVRDDDEAAAAARRLIEQCGFSIVVAKRSEQGMTIALRDGHVHHLRAEAREVFDVSGAGDTVTATLAAGLSIGLSIRDAAALANLAAGVAVGKLGTAPTTRQELLQAISATERVASDCKLWSLDQAASRVRHWKQSGLRVGFTNGCYDLLHPGHIRLLEEARGACDRLVVGLNTDDSVRRLKGPRRPIQTELARATVLASLASVDAVVLFGDDTPLELIRTLKPDVLFKGADYSVETVVGASDVIAAGGQVVLIDLVPDQSTSRLVRRMSEPEQRSAA